MYKKIQKIKAKLHSKFPSDIYIGFDYTIADLDKDLSNLMGTSSNRPKTSDCDSEKCQFDSDCSLQ